MHRRIGVTWPAHVPTLEALPTESTTLRVMAPARFGERPHWCVASGDHVAQGECLATGEHVDHHAPRPGRIVSLANDAALIDLTSPSAPLPPPPPDNSYADFLKRIGLVGMGGSMFPAARKVAAGDNYHTLVINGVECEPGITIDQSLLLHASEAIRAAVDFATAQTGAQRVVLAVGRSRTLVAQLKSRYPYELLQMPRAYPAGAERLIMQRLTKRMPPVGELPMQLGYLVQNVASLWAVGRAIATAQPILERPLTLAAPAANRYHNWVVPIGTPIQHLLTTAEISYDPTHQILIGGGLMMGHPLSPEDSVDKGTTAVLVMPRQGLQELPRDCIRCGACNAACPLSLHPIGIVDRAATHAQPSAALRSQLATCFLCGACEAVCPSNIQLIKHLKEAKQWIGTHPPS